MDTYKKKYKGALARCKWLLSEGMISRIAATDLFRELMDNDSENVRREIINIFHSLAEGKIPVDINYADISTWLEKQGEQKSTNKVEPKFKVGDYIERKDGLGCHAKVIYIGKNVYGCEKLIYPKDSSPFFELMFENQDEFRMSSDFQQKPAWSEEDEVMIKVFDSIIRYIVEVVDKDALERFGTNREELFSWLKSLRSQSKQEWSEEDNWIKTKIIKVLLGCETFLTSEETNECIDWIKSIKQRLKGKS